MKERDSHESLQKKEEKKVEVIDYKIKKENDFGRVRRKREEIEKKERRKREERERENLEKKGILKTFGIGSLAKQVASSPSLRAVPTPLWVCTTPFGNPVDLLIQMLFLILR